MAAGNTHLTLVSYELCPFVQRCTITLEEKGVPYDITYIDLSQKPAWFLERSPLGKVPILMVGQDTLFESAVINEFIDEFTGPPHLLPADPLKRARLRAWVEVTAELLRKTYTLMTATHVTAAQTAAEACHHILLRFEQSMDQGPYFADTHFSLVDTAAAPALQRLGWCVELLPSLPVFDSLPKVLAWKAALLSRPSVERSTVPDIKERFFAFLRRGGEPVGPPYGLANYIRE